MKTAVGMPLTAPSEIPELGIMFDPEFSSGTMRDPYN